MSTYAVVAIAIVVSCSVLAAVSWIGMRLKRPSRPSPAPVRAAALSTATHVATASVALAPLAPAPVVAAASQTAPAPVAQAITDRVAPTSQRTNAQPDNAAQAAFDNVAEQILRARHRVRTREFPLRPQADALIADAERCYAFAVAAARVDQAVSAFVLLQRASGSAAQSARLVPPPPPPKRRPGLG